MPRLKVIPTILVACLALTGCGVIGSTSDNSEKAYEFAKRACEGKNKLSWQSRTDLAAKANFLDPSWNHLYDSLSSLTAIEKLSETQVSWESAPGNDGVQIAYQNAKMYSIFYAECTRID